MLPSTPATTQFPSTSWSALRHVRDRGSPEYARQLERLATLYWKPVYCVIRYGWARPEEDARDLTQEFFATNVLHGRLFETFAPERGSFRAYLKGAVFHFMAKTARAAETQKRGGGGRPLSLEGDVPGLVDLLADPAAATPEAIFDAAWNNVVFAQALEATADRLRAEGNEEYFEAFRRYDLEPEPEGTSYEALAERLGWTPRKVKRALAVARAAFWDALADIARGYVDGPEDLQQELRALLPR
jgi:DNA-directed RNA polymerase specialized sigma24 family protein